MRPSLRLLPQFCCQLLGKIRHKPRVVSVFASFSTLYMQTVLSAWCRFHIIISYATDLISVLPFFSIQKFLRLVSSIIYTYITFKRYIVFFSNAIAFKLSWKHHNRSNLKLKCRLSLVCCFEPLYSSLLHAKITRANQKNQYEKIQVRLKSDRSVRQTRGDLISICCFL